MYKKYKTVSSTAIFFFSSLLLYKVFPFWFVAQWNHSFEKQDHARCVWKNSVCVCVCMYDDDKTLLLLFVHSTVWLMACVCVWKIYLKENINNKIDYIKKLSFLSSREKTYSPIGFHLFIPDRNNWKWSRWRRRNWLRVYTWEKKKKSFRRRKVEWFDCTNMWQIFIENERKRTKKT